MLSQDTGEKARYYWKQERVMHRPRGEWTVQRAQEVMANQMRAGYKLFTRDCHSAVKDLKDAMHAHAH